MWRRIPIDVIALVAIILVIMLSHPHFVEQGQCFNDASWYFHFGHRLTANGDVPYRDYLFQVGPLPIYVDAGFQEVFGFKYASSLYAAMTIKMLRVWVVWMIVRRLVSWRAALGVAVFCILDPAFAFVYHWSTPYAQLFISLAGLFLVLASSSEGRRAIVYLFFAGVNAALVVSARQSTAVMLGLVLLVASSIMLVRKECFTRRRFVALWAGFATGIVLVFGFLAMQGALGAAIQQMFLDAPAKKGIHGIDAVLDAISGGALIHYQFDPTFTWWSGLLVFVGLPITAVSLILYLGSREQPVTTNTVAMLVIPVAIVFGVLTRRATLDLLTDLPRTFFTVVTALAVLFPKRLRDWFGIEPIVAIGLGALPLASDWALEMSNPGRGWGDPPAMIVAMILISLACTKLTVRARQIFAGALGIAGVVNLVASLHGDFNPFGNDGMLTETTFKLKNPMLKGMKFTEGRKKILDWLSNEVKPGSSCFIYGNVPVVYTLLRCNNPTRVDTTAADFLTVDDADAAIAILKANPPDYIIAHDRAWMNPPLGLDLHADPVNYTGMNPKVSMSLHVGLRSILDRYESVGLAADVVGPALAKQTFDKWDAFDQVRIYRLRH